MLDLSNLDVSGFTPDTTDIYASIIDLSGSTATIWKSTSTSLVSGITLGSGFLNITGTSGADSLAGNGETNTINGGGGNDLLQGGGIRDTLNGEEGNDTLTGGAGADTFVIAVGGNSNSGSDTITDFDVTATTGDKVQIDWRETADAPANLATAGLALGTDTDGNAVLTDSTDTSIIYLTFEGIAQAELEATHFEFV